MTDDAAAAFKRVLRTMVAPALRAAGLKGSGQTYVLPNASHWAQVGFQKSTGNTASTVKFTVNLKVTDKDWWDEQRRDHSPLKDIPPAGVDRATWDERRLRESAYPSRPSANTSGEGRSMRIGHLIPGVEADHWWSITSEDAEQVMAEALAAVVIYGLPWLRQEVREPTSS